MRRRKKACILMSCQCALGVSHRGNVHSTTTDELLIGRSMSSEQKKKDEVESENVKLAAWDLISKYFSLEALGKFEFLFKIINLKGDSVMTSLEMDDFLYGAGVDFKASNYEAIYKACTHGENEMDLAEFLIFIYQLKTAAKLLDELQFLQNSKRNN